MLACTFSGGAAPFQPVHCGYCWGGGGGVGNVLDVLGCGCRLIYPITVSEDAAALPSLQLASSALLTCRTPAFKAAPLHGRPAGANSCSAWRVGVHIATTGEPLTWRLDGFGGGARQSLLTVQSIGVKLKLANYVWPQQDQRFIRSDQLL